MSGGLMHLVTIETNSRLTRNTTSNIDPYANESIVLNLDSMVNNLSRRSDLILPEYLLVDMNMNITTFQDISLENTIIDIIANYKLTFDMNGNVQSIPLQMLDYLEKATITPRNKLKIPINYNYFFNNNDGLPIVAIQFININVSVSHITNGSRLDGVKLICKGKYLDTTARRTLVSVGSTYTYKSRDICTLNLISNTLLNNNNNNIKNKRLSFSKT